MTKGTESISYTYDGKLVTSEAMTGTLGQAINYAYNNDFNLTSVTYAGGTASLSYDNDSLLTSAGGFTITRNANNGLPTSVADAGMTQSRTFNAYGEMSDQGFTVSSNSLHTWGLTFNDIGRIDQKQETVNGTSSTYVYTYDPMGRLLTVTKDSTLVEQYTYSANGVRASEMNTRKGTNRTLTYSDEDQILTAGSVTYTYDDDGFLTNKTNGTDQTTYTYSARGELLSVVRSGSNPINIEYIYDPLGRRIAKKVNGSITEKYLWQGMTQLLAVYDASNNLKMRFIYADSRMPVAVVKNGTTYYLSYDQIGSLKLVSDSSGVVQKQIEYDTFGYMLSDSNPSFEVPFGFAGGLYDKNTELIRFGARDYDPDLGRWTAKDPILFAGGDTDLYGYCVNDPVNLVDTMGLWAFSGEAYAGIGGGFSIGVDECGKLFISTKFGAGIGGGFAFTPGDTPCSDAMTSLGIEYNAGVNSGPWGSWGEKFSGGLGASFYEGKEEIYVDRRTLNETIGPKGIYGSAGANIAVKSVFHPRNIIEAFN